MQATLALGATPVDDRKKQKRLHALLIAVVFVVPLLMMFLPFTSYNYTKTSTVTKTDDSGKRVRERVTQEYSGDVSVMTVIWRYYSDGVQNSDDVVNTLADAGIQVKGTDQELAALWKVVGAPVLLIFLSGLAIVFLMMRPDNHGACLLCTGVFLFGAWVMLTNTLMKFQPLRPVMIAIYVFGAVASVAHLIYCRAHRGVAMHGVGAEYRRRLLVDIKRDVWLYILVIPGLVYFLIFHYLPMWGIVFSFENFVPYSGVFGSAWKGLYWFEYFFKSNWDLYLSNTLILSFMSILLTFPAPIILALMLNEIRHVRYKKLTQTLLYVPHFISIVIVVSITYVIFGSTGIVYKATTMLLGHSIDYLGDPKAFRWMIIGQSIWKETGWGTIIFLAALTNVDTQLYEAAMIDGANRGQRLWHITLPAIRSVVVLMLILRVGSVLNTGYEHLILMANSLNRTVSQTLDVFVYQNGIKGGQYSYSTAVGLMKSIVSVIMVISANKVSHMLGEEGLY